MPEELPTVIPWKSSGEKPQIVSDGPNAVSAAVRAASLWGRGEASPPDAGAVTDTPAGPAADVSVTASTDTDTADTDTAENLPAVAEFGREISPATRFGIAATRGSGVVIRAAGKGIVQSETWKRKPTSLSGHHAWIGHEEWIPGEVREEPVIKLLVFARNVWGWTAGMVLAGVGNFISWLSHPLYFFVTAAALGLLYVFVIR